MSPIDPIRYTAGDEFEPKITIKRQSVIALPVDQNEALTLIRGVIFAMRKGVTISWPTAPSHRKILVVP